MSAITKYAQYKKPVSLDGVSAACRRQSSDTKGLLIANALSFQVKYAKMKNARKKNLVGNRMQAHQFQWQKEWIYLRDLQKKLRNGVTKLLDDGAKMDESKQGCIDLQHVLQQELQHFSQSLFGPIKQLTHKVYSTKMSKSRENLDSTSALLQTSKSAMKDIGDILAMQEEELGKELCQYNSSWLLRMSSDEDEDLNNNKGEEMLAQMAGINSLNTNTSNTNPNDNIIEKHQQWDYDPFTNDDNYEKHKDKNHDDYNSNKEIKLEEGSTEIAASIKNVCQEWYKKVCNLQTDYKAKVDGLDIAYKEYCKTYNDLFNAKNCIEGQIVLIPWSKDEHLQHKKLYQSYTKRVKQQHGASTGKLLLDRLHLQFPNRSLVELQQRNEWLQRQIYYLQHKKVLSKTYEKTHQEMIEAAMTDILKTTDEAAEHQMQIKLNEQRQLESDERHSVLNALKERKQALEEQIALDKKESQRLEAMEAEVKMERQLKRQYHNKELLCEHLDKKHKEAHIAELVKNQKLIVERKEKEMLSIVNEQRVVFRQEEQKMKEYKRHIEVQEAMKQAALKQQRLDSLAASVGIEAERDPLRLLQSTSSLTAEAYRKQQFNVVKNGYSDDKVFSDKRVRITEMIYAQGLNKTVYGSQLMMAMQPKLEMRPF